METQKDRKIHRDTQRKRQTEIERHTVRNMERETFTKAGECKMTDDPTGRELPLRTERTWAQAQSSS